jgi:hypothetical protein
MFDKMILAAVMTTAPFAALEAQQPPAPPVAATAPAGPVDPARLAAAERMVAAMWPEQLFIEAFTAAGSQGIPGLSAAPSPGAAARDPNHAERMRLARQAESAEFTRLIRAFLPEMRTLAARFYARQLSATELDETARFYSSPAGRNFLQGSLRMADAAGQLQGMRPPQPDPALLASFMAIAQRIETATAHLKAPAPAASPRPSAAPPPPPPPRASARRATPPAVTMAPPAPPRPPAPRAAATTPADPARLAAARRAVALLVPAEALAQPLPLTALLEAVSSVPLASFGPIVPPGTPANATVGQMVTGGDPNGMERARIAARIAQEELPAVLPRAAPVMHDAMAELFARTYSVAELDALSAFYETPAGRAMARQTVTAMVDPEFIRGLMMMAPRVMAEGFGSIVRIGQATAHLPPAPSEPVRTETPDSADDDEDDDDEG